MVLQFKKCTIDDLETLRMFSIKTYRDTFGYANSEENMKEYLEKAFNHDQLSSELQNPKSVFYFLYGDEALAGYIKVNAYGAQSDINDPQSVELERIYVSKDFQGRGIGEALLQKALELANEMKGNYMWLGVWENNTKAIAFYTKHDFIKVGQHSFFMGDDEQFDHIMRRELI